MEYCTTLHQAVSLPNLAFVSSQGRSRSSLQRSQPCSLSKAAGVSPSEPRTPLPLSKVLAKAKRRGPRRSHCPARETWSPQNDSCTCVPPASLAKGPRISTPLPSPAAPLSVSPRPGGHVRLQLSRARSAGRGRRGHRLERLRGLRAGGGGGGRARSDWWVPSGGAAGTSRAPRPVSPGQGGCVAGGSSLGVACAWCCGGGGAGRSGEMPVS